MACEKFFTAIKDGEWHNIDDLAQLLAISIQKLTECIRFLTKQGILAEQQGTKNIRIEPDWKERLPEGAFKEETAAN